MKIKRNSYREAIKQGVISPNRNFNELKGVLQKHLKLEALPEELIKNSELGPKITSSLTCLQLYVAKGHKSWGGLVIGFPGTKEQLSTESVSTPYLREILYPILDLHGRFQKHESKRMPCIYILGERFSDVFLRKFRLLNSITHHVIILTNDLLKNLLTKSRRLSPSPTKITEAWIQWYLCKRMSDDGYINLPIDSGVINAGLITHELPTFEGTKNPERLDMLCFDRNDHSLIAFEIKGPNSGRVQLENLFLQGVEHRNWIEENKMAIKLLFEGPKGKNINNRKRVRLVLGFCSDTVPNLFYELRYKAIKKDPHLKIDFLKLIPPKNTVGNLELQEFSFI